MGVVDLSKTNGNTGGQPKGWSLILPWGGKSKPRPRVTSRGTYNDSEYTQWKEAVAEWVVVAGVPVLSGPLSLLVKFKKESMEVMLSEGAPPRFGQSDIDNMSGGLMDALQLSGTFKNDIQIAQLSAQIIKEIKDGKKA